MAKNSADTEVKVHKKKRKGSVKTGAKREDVVERRRFSFFFLSPPPPLSRWLLDPLYLFFFFNSTLLWPHVRSSSVCARWHVPFEWSAKALPLNRAKSKKEKKTCLQLAPSQRKKKKRGEEKTGDEALFITSATPLIAIGNTLFCLFFFFYCVSPRFSTMSLASATTPSWGRG